MSGSNTGGANTPGALLSATVTMTETLVRTRTVHVMATAPAAFALTAFAAVGGVGQYTGPEGSGVVRDLGADWSTVKSTMTYTTAAG